MSDVPLLDFIRRFTAVVLVGIGVGAIALVLFYLYLHKKSPPAAGEVKSSQSADMPGPGFDLMLDLPVSNERIDTPTTTVAGRTLYTKNRVLLITSGGGYYSLSPGANGAFAVEVPVESGPNQVSAYVFPQGYFARTKQKLFVSFPAEDTGAAGNVIIGKVRHVASDYFLVAGIEGGFTRVSVGHARMVRFGDDGAASAIGLNDLTNEEIVSVFSAGDLSQKRVVATAVFAKPFHISFAAQVKDASGTITLAPRTGWGTDIRLVPGRQFRVVAYDEGSGTFTDASAADVKSGDKVVVDGLDVPEKTDELVVRTLILLHPTLIP